MGPTSKQFDIYKKQSPIDFNLNNRQHKTLKTIHEITYILTNPTFNIPSHFWRNFRNCVCIIGLFCCMMMWWPKKFYYCFYGIVFLDMAGPYHAFFLSSPAVLMPFIVIADRAMQFTVWWVQTTFGIGWGICNYRLKSFILQYTQLVKCTCYFEVQVF